MVWDHEVATGLVGMTMADQVLHIGDVLVQRVEEMYGTGARADALPQWPITTPRIRSQRSGSRRIMAQA